MSSDLAAESDANARDAAWMRRIAAGDRAALGALVAAHQRRVVQTAYRFLGTWDAAEDVAQETFLRVYRAAPDYQPQAAFTTWLYRLVVNLCWDQRRRVQREQRRRARLPAEPIVSESVACDRAELAESVRASVRALPDRQRLAVILHRFNELSHREIADVTGWSVGAVESCLVRAYASLRKALRDVAT